MKPYECTEKEKRYLRAQYQDLVKHYDKMNSPVETNQIDLAVNFNYMHAMVSMNVYFMETLRRILITKGIATKEEINNVMDEVYEEEMKKKNE
jgi:hypothetical protein